VRRVAPLAVGTSEISYGGKLREVMVAGTTAELHRRPHASKLAQGASCPMATGGAARRWRSSAPRSARSCSAAEPALGQLIRIGDRRFRVVGVMAGPARAWA
jgi:putative ABC transport system permease protein